MASIEGKSDPLSVEAISQRVARDIDQSGLYVSGPVIVSTVAEMHQVAIVKSYLDILAKRRLVEVDRVAIPKNTIPPQQPPETISGH